MRTNVLDEIRSRCERIAMYNRWIENLEREIVELSAQPEVPDEIKESIISLIDEGELPEGLNWTQAWLAIAKMCEE
jgi:hypothetical protein